MIEAERQQVIDALEYADGCRYCRDKIAAALAIMQREPVAGMDADGKVMSDADKRQVKGFQPWNVQPYQPRFYKD